MAQTNRFDNTQVTTVPHDVHMPSDTYVTYDPSLYSDYPNVKDETFDLVQILRIILRRKWLILAILALGLAIAVVYTKRQTPLYRAVSTLEFQKREAQILDTDNVQNIIVDNEFINTQLNLMKSRSVAGRVAEISGLTNNPKFVNINAPIEARRRVATSKLISSLKISPLPRSLIVKVEYVSDDPQIAANVANAFAENFIDITLERKFNTTEYVRNFLSERLITAKQTLEDGERQIVEYAQENNILEITSEGGEVSLDGESLKLLNTKLAQAQSDTLDRQLALEKSKVATQTTRIIDNEVIKRLKERRSDLEAEYQDKLGTYKPKYPYMVQLQNRIDDTQTEIAEEIKLLTNAFEVEADSDYAAALIIEKTIIEKIAILKSNLQNQRDKRIEYNILQREADTARSQYEAILQRLKEVSIIEGIGSSQVSIVDNALVPARPFSPNLRQALLQALILSLTASMALVFILNFIDDTIKTPDDIKTKLKMPAIGVIPKEKEAKNLIVTSLKDPKSEITEAYLSARTALEFASDNGTPSSLLITSSRPSEGKSSSSIALAILFAKIGRRVLIIDGDMRKPSFVSDTNKSIGLSGLLTSQQSLIDNILETDEGNLYLLPSGIVPPNPAQLLSGIRLKEIIDEAEANFDLVIVDSPPVMNFADSPLLAAQCKGSLLVTKSGLNRTPNVKQSIERLNRSKSKLIGVILTQFDAKKAGYGYGYGSGYYYYAYGKEAYSYGKNTLEGKSTSSINRKIDIIKTDV